jgi:hypothetical protein
VSRHKLKAISTRPSQPRGEGRVEIAPLTPNTVACSASQSAISAFSSENPKIVSSASPTVHTGKQQNLP